MAIKDALDFYKQQQLANTSGMDTSWMGDQWYTDPNGLSYQPYMDQTGQNYYAAYNQGQSDPGMSYELFQGDQSLGQRQFTDPGNGMKELAMMLGFAGGMQMLPGGMFSNTVLPGQAGSLNPSATLPGSGMPTPELPSWEHGGFPGEAPWSPTPGSTPLDFGMPPVEGVPPPANPFVNGVPPVAPSGSPGGPGVTPPNPFVEAAPSLIPGISNKTLGGIATTGLGALSGGAGGGGGAGGAGAGGSLDPRMAAAIYDNSEGLVPRTQGLLGRTAGDAFGRGEMVADTGAGLLNRNVAGNGFGQVALNAPTTPTNPYATGILDDLQRRSGQLIDQKLLGIQGRQVSAGGVGGDRMGLAQGTAISQGQDNFVGQAANLMGGLYNSDQNRSLQQYGMDQGFYQGQRGQDLAQAGFGAGLLQQGQDLTWNPLQQAKSVYAPFTGLNSSAGSGGSSSGGWQGVLGGAMQGAALAGKMSWW